MGVKMKSDILMFLLPHDSIIGVIMKINNPFIIPDLKQNQ